MCKSKHRWSSAWIHSMQGLESRFQHILFLWNSPLTACFALTYKWPLATLPSVRDMGQGCFVPYSAWPKEIPEHDNTHFPPLFTVHLCPANQPADWGPCEGQSSPSSEPMCWLFVRRLHISIVLPWCCQSLTAEDTCSNPSCSTRICRLKGFGRNSQNLLVSPSVSDLEKMFP